MDDDHALTQMEQDPEVENEDEQDNIDEEDEEDEDDGDYEDEDVEDSEDYEDEEMVLSETSEQRSLIVDGSKESEVKEKKIEDNIDACPICFEGWTSGGDHRMCCLPCGHIYGKSCISKWLIYCQGDGKCPQCKRLCTFKDIRVLYATRLCVANEKPHEASTAKYPYTKEGFSEFQQHISSCLDDMKQRINLLEQRAEDFDSRLQLLQQRCNELMGQTAQENSR